MKRIMLLILILLAVSAISFTLREDKKTKKPHEEIKVNKHYDEHGNLTSFDSTYVYSWSGDTTITGFPGGIDIPDFFENHGNLFDNDSLFFADPFDGFGFDNNMPDIFKEFERMFSDTPNMDYFSFQNDSILKFNNDSIHHFGFDFFFDDINKQPGDTTIRQQFPGFRHHFFLDNDSIMKRQEKMMKEYMKELEKFQKQFFNME